ncbi:MAG: aminopeptidase [Flavobacteriales bacterium]|nr:aminopeptidase [Flavobacteriales bacterium]
MKQGIVATILLLGFFSAQLIAQDTIRNKKDGKYFFTVVKDLETTQVEDQYRTGTCWSFSALSFLESELMRMRKGKHELSEMYIVRMAYLDKADKYIRYHGSINFGQGGAFHDIPYVVSKYGIVPKEAYPGLSYGEEKHNHSELEAVLKGICDAVLKSGQGKLTSSWKKAVEGVLDAYLGAYPAEFTYQGKSYSPLSFAKSLDLNMDEYVILGSYTHHPFYTSFILEVPDNWAMGSVHNMPLNEFMQAIDDAVMGGYSVAWAADVSEKGFSFRNGLAIVPKDPDALKVSGKDNKHFNQAGAVRTGTQFDSPGEELRIDQEMRQKAFDNFETTDDHGMHIVGIFKDQKGTKYYRVKNSWGTENDCDGYFYASEAYVAYKTLNVMVHKKALSAKSRKNLGL